MVSCFFLLRVAVSSTFVAVTLHIKKGLTASNVLETATRSKKTHETFVEGHMLRTADIMNARVPDCVFVRK